MRISLDVYMTADEFDTVKRCADDQGISLDEWVARVVAQEASFMDPYYPDPVADQHADDWDEAPGYL